MASEMSFYGGQGINLKPERFLFNLPNSIMSFRSMVSFAWPTLYLRFRRLVQSLSRFSACLTKHLKLATLSHTVPQTTSLSALLAILREPEYIHCYGDIQPHSYPSEMMHYTHPTRIRCETVVKVILRLRSQGSVATQISVVFIEDSTLFGGNG